VSVEHAEEADLGPLNVKIGLVAGLEDIENDAHSVFIVVSNYALVSIRCVRFDDSAFLLAGLCRFMIFELDCLRVERNWIFSEQKGLHFHKLDIRIFLFFARKRSGNLESRIIVALVVVGGVTCLCPGSLAC